ASAADDARGALAAWTRAFELARASAPLALESGLGRTRAALALDDAALAARAWTEALAAGRAARDPRLLRHALDIRPAASEWTGTGWESESAAWRELAEIEHARGELALALLDAAHACSAATADTRPRCELVRARVLAALGRRGEACDAVSALTTAADDGV